jgi:DNA-binding CsgD family transcriptional regulator
VLLEREEELAQLRTVVAAALGGRGGLVLVEGPAGIGKTRLLDVVRTDARAGHMLVLAARASELDREFPFGVLRQLFEPLLASADADRRAQLLRGAAGPSAGLLGLGEAPLPGGATDDPSPLHFHALYWLTANLAEHSPVALVIDDVHWADPVSLRFLQFLLPRLEELPVLVALAARPNEAGPTTRPTLDAVGTDPATRVIRPAPLSEGAVAAVIDEEMGTDPAGGGTDPAARGTDPAAGGTDPAGVGTDPAGVGTDPAARGTDPRRLALACREATGGNPLLLRELLRALRADGVVPTPEAVREVAPPTVGRAVLLRLARQGDAAVDLARALAILGDGAPTRRAARLAGIDEDEADDLAGTLARADILAPARPLAFAHPILRAAVYADVDPGDRARAHRNAAELLATDGADATAIAVHLLETEPAADPRTVATLRDAAERALARGAATTAVACLERALREPPAAQQRGPVLLELGTARLRADDPPGAAAAFDEGARVTSDPRTRAARASEQSVALLAVNRRDEAFALLEAAIEDVAAADPDLALSLEASLIGIARFDRKRIGWLRRRLERYQGRLAGASPGERVLLAAQTHLDAFSRQSTKPAEELADAAERALGDGRLLDDGGGPSPPFCYAIDVLLLADRLDVARHALEAAVEDARHRGAAPWFWFLAGMRCGLLTREGSLPAAEADGRSAAELALGQGWSFAIPHMLGSLVGVLVDRGELDDAEHYLAQGDLATREPTQVLTQERVLHARARLRAARGDLEGARADFERLGPPRARWNTYPTLVPPVLVAPQLAGEDDDAARAQVEQMQRQAQTWGTPRAIGMALHAKALLDDDLELLEEAARTLDGSPARLEHARALTDLGAALRRANRRAAAREPLRRALDVADGCGARPLADRARHELRAAGGRPRRPRTSGAEALTASERRIATMAADGLSNPEIAQSLFVTTKTVESHLSNAYRKLDIAGRTELGNALRATSPAPPS